MIPIDRDQVEARVRQMADAAMAANPDLAHLTEREREYVRIALIGAATSVSEMILRIRRVIEAGDGETVRVKDLLDAIHGGSGAADL